MKNQISILMDGELCDEEANALFKKIKHDDEANQEWLTFHLIRDVLQQPDYVANDLSQSLFARLQVEPTVLAPQPKRNVNVRYFSLSAVASILAMAVLTWLLVQIDVRQENLPKYQQAKQPSNIAPLMNTAMDDEMIKYLHAHHEFSPSIDVRGASSYIKTVAFNYSEVKR